MSEIDWVREALGFAAYALAIGGTWMVAKGHRAGWLIGLLGNAAWVVTGCYLGFWNMIIWSLIWAIPNYQGWKTGREQQPIPETPASDGLCLSCGTTCGGDDFWPCSAADAGPDV